MKIYLEDIDINQGSLELFRIISRDNYELINEKDKCEEGLLLYSKLFLKPEKTYIRTELFEDDLSVKTMEIDLDDIDVKIDSLKKKVDVAFKQSLLKIFETNLPWGILTGIRPTKIVHKLLDKGLDMTKIFRILKEGYLIRDDKLDLLWKVCHRQRAYLEKSKDKYSLYIGIPFCPSRCLYCSFTSLSINKNKDLVEGYITSLIYELEESKKLMGDRPLNTIYIGGGTPTALDMKDLEKIICNLRRIFGKAEELTIEAGRPDTLNREYLKMFRENNVDRISINPQTMNDETLKFIGRNHTSQDIVDVYKLAKAEGIENINMDLILGLPGENYESLVHTLEKIESLNPNNLTVHSLALKTNSLFAKLADQYEIIGNQEAEKIAKLVDTYAEKMGLEAYYLYRQKHIVGNLENIGYGRGQSLCKYNISMMEERETILGIGVGSVSKIVNGSKIKRVANFKSIEDYIKRVDELIERKKRYL